MSSIFKKTFFIPCLSMLLMGSSVAALAAPGQEITEARQEAQIWTTYALSPYLRASDLKVTVNNGKAILTGMVEEDVNKDLATQIALGVSGIKDVDNNIQVQADYKPTSSERSYGDVIDDISITAAIKSKLVWSKSTNGLAIEVKTNSGKVTLAGNVKSNDSKKMAERLASGTQGVVSVSNNIEVNGVADNSDKDKGKVEGKISDAWITTKVKSTFLYSSNVTGSDISVATKEGVVTLSGKVDTGVERELAIELAQNIRGVKTVNAKQLTH